MKKPRLKNTRFGWRGIIVFLLCFLGIISATGYTLARWTDKQILTTDTWVSTVAPLPKNEEVATSLSAYTVSKLFDSADLQKRISEALPPKAGFLVPPLVEQLTQRITKLVKNIIKSDQFQGIWVAVNRAAHQRILAAARDDTASSAPKESKFNLDFKSVFENIRERLGTTSALAVVPGETAGSQAGTPSQEASSIQVGLKAGRENLKKSIQAIDFLNATLWLLALACLLGALAVTRNRRRLLLIISSIVALISLLQLIGVKALRPAILNQIEEGSYKPAVGVIYDTLLLAFQRGATALFILALLVFAASLVIREKNIKRNKWAAANLKSLKSSKPWQQVSILRHRANQYRFYIIGTICFIVLAYLAFIPEFDWVGLIRSLLLILILVAVVNLFSRPLPAPKKKSRR